MFMELIATTSRTTTANLLKPVPHWCTLATTALPFQSVPNEQLNLDENAIATIMARLEEAQRQLSAIHQEMVRGVSKCFSLLPEELVREIGSYVPFHAKDVRVALVKQC